MSEEKFGTTGAGQTLNAPTLVQAGNYAVLTDSHGGGTLNGTALGDRFGSNGNNTKMSGGAGNDVFIQHLNTNLAATAHDTVEGGDGFDTYALYMSSGQMTTSVQSELQRMAGFLISSKDGAVTTFHSDVLHVELSGIEEIKVNVDGVTKQISSVVSQAIVDGSAGNDLLDGHDWHIPLAFRGSAGDDTMIGGSANDRFAFGGGGDSISGGAGNDLFISVFDAHASTARDVVDGGTGNDVLAIYINSSQVTDTVKGELQALQDHLVAGEAFTSNLLHLDISNVESALIKVDGVNHALSDWLLPH